MLVCCTNARQVRFDQVLFHRFLGIVERIPPFEQEKRYRLLKHIVTSPVEQGLSIVAVKTILRVCRQ